MKKLLVSLSLIFSSTSIFAGLPEMMKIYNNPSSAPNTEYCAVADDYCKAFTALAKQWQSIPSNYRYKGKWDIKKDAAKGDAYGLNKGFYLYNERSVDLSDGGEVYYDFSNPKKEAIFARGLAVIMYIEDKNGWTKE
ncbi:hypothetical protein VXO74_15095 [Acinetobacter junii]|uniref:hypothetical protein n=1 Tax=Acinetobacter junii TaxID=40215 RepID=UPI003A856B7B